jgi:hypothetical protein
VKNKFLVGDFYSRGDLDDHLCIEIHVRPQ